MRPSRSIFLGANTTDIDGRMPNVMYIMLPISFSCSPSSSRFPGKSYPPIKDLNQWGSFAPAILDNYMTRSLLGRHYMHCR